MHWAFGTGSVLCTGGNQLQDSIDPSNVARTQTDPVVLPLAMQIICLKRY